MTPDDLEVLLKVVVSVCLGGLIGIERELSHKPAGIRTHMFVAGAATMMVVSNQDIFAVVWEDTPVNATANLEKITEEASANKNVGEVTLEYGAIEGDRTVRLAGGISPPSTGWRLKRYI